IACLCISFASLACDREARPFRGEPTRDDRAWLREYGRRLDAPPRERGPYDANAWAVLEGARLYRQMNCVGCHGGRGGGGMGPPLIGRSFTENTAPADIYVFIRNGSSN